MSQRPLRIGFYGVAFEQHTAIMAQPLIAGLLAAGVEVTLIDPPAELDRLHLPGMRRAALRSAHRQVDSLYVGKPELLKAARTVGLPIVLDAGAQLFNAQLPKGIACLSPIENPAWAQAHLARPVMTLRGLPRSAVNNSDPLRIVSVMPLEWESGLEFAIDAAAQVIRAGVPLRYTIVGAGSYEDALIYGARLWGLWQTGQIVFQPPERRAEALAEADLLLHAPYVGRFEPTVLEALGRGLAMIISDAMPLPHIVGTAAYQVARRQPDALRDAILRVVSQPDDERKRLAAAALHQAERHENTGVDAWIAAYQQALSTSTRR
jgi:glycosyltransferase involved in cell wall biosynthesis